MKITKSKAKWKRGPRGRYSKSDAAPTPEVPEAAKPYLRVFRLLDQKQPAPPKGEKRVVVRIGSSMSLFDGM